MNQKVAVRLKNGQRRLYRVDGCFDHEVLRRHVSNEVPLAATILVEVKAWNVEQEKAVA